jgi:hypothetical protein
VVTRAGVLAAPDALLFIKASVTTCRARHG